MLSEVGGAFPFIAQVLYGIFNSMARFWGGPGTWPWNHFHMCTVVLWTKIVVEFMFLYSRLQR